MAIICPQCGTPIDQDFGVATCGSCAAVVFIDLDGNATLSDGPAQTSGASATPQETPVEYADLPNYDPAIQEIPPEPEMELPEAPIAPIEEEPFVGEPEFRDTDQALGPLSYSVIVAKIDTKELRNQVLEAINDPKFGWDPREVIRTVREGVLQLKDLSPVKASVVVQKLRDLPVEISWTQNVYK